MEAQNNLRRMSYGGSVTLSKTWQSHAVRFSFMPMGHEVTGLKTYRGPKRKEQFSVCSLPGYMCGEQEDEGNR